jgi:hypothetical protein
MNFKIKLFHYKNSKEFNKLIYNFNNRAFLNLNNCKLSCKNKKMKNKIKFVIWMNRFNNRKFKFKKFRMKNKIKYLRLKIWINK